MPYEFVDPEILYQDDNLIITCSYGDENMMDDEDYKCLRVYNSSDGDLSDDAHLYEFNISEVGIAIINNYREFKSNLAQLVEDGYITLDGIVEEPEVEGKFVPDTSTGKLFEDEELDKEEQIHENPQ